MRAVSEVAVRPIEPRRLEPFIGHERVDALIDAATTLRRLLQARRIVNVNSTATGGGVAEMLHDAARLRAAATGLDVALGS